MKRILTLPIVLLTVFPLVAAEPTIVIKLNTVGYLPTSPKRASISAPCKEFTLIRGSDGLQVFKGQVLGPTLNTDTQEQLYTADFSEFRDPGVYRLRVADIGESPPFQISPDIYVYPFQTVVRAMYLWRCGIAVTGTNNGAVFSHAACHTNDAWLDVIESKHEIRPSLRGWHDAGDYNKYVVNAGITVGSMFRAWEAFGPAIRKIALGIPESGGPLPDFLAELKWETDWLLTMQLEDGAVSHKVSTKKFGGFILPEEEKTERFFTHWSSAATADFVAMIAQAARNFAPYDKPYAERCLAAARKSYGFLQSVPTNHSADLSGFSTGAYGTRDSDDRLWAAAEVWESTGAPDVLRDLETRIRDAKAAVREDFDWGEVGNLGVFTYLNSKRFGRDEALLAQTRSNLLAAADRIVQTASSHGYQRPLGSRYYWGCNGSVARQALTLQAAFRLDPKPAFRESIADALNHLFGRNYHGRSYITGLGHLPPLYPHDRRSGGDAVDAPWPGYLVGGPHPKPANWKDAEEDYRTNEIAINWNGALIYALAALLPD